MKSNDDDPNVQIEIRAAELELKVRWPPVRVSRSDQAVAEIWGYNDHDNEIAWDADHEVPGWHTGYLAREMRTHESHDARDAYAWPWDLCRPIAGQYEERVAHQQRGDAMLEEALIAEIASAPPREPTP